MSRYIDADELHDQGWVAARYINWEPTPLNNNFRLEVEVKPFITFPAVDVVEVVRCKDCKHSEEFIYPEGLEIMVCWEDSVDREVNRNGFCEKGERKDG